MSTADEVRRVLDSQPGGKWAGDHYRGPCPWRAGSDGQALSVKIEGPENGTYYDFKDGSGGSLYDIADLLGIERPKVQKIESTLVKYAGLAEYAKAHGVEVAVFEAARWTETTRANRPALTFPTSGGQRWRYLDGERPKYDSITGYKSCWYGLQRAIAQATPDLPLLIVNGEASVIVCQHFGLPAACKTGGEAQLPQALVTELAEQYPPGEVWIALDCDETGRAASAKIARQLHEAGRTARILDLLLSEHGDAADVCMLYTTKSAERFRELAKAAPVYEPPDATKQAIEALNQSLGQLTGAVRDTERTSDLTTLLARVQSQLDAVTRRTTAPAITGICEVGATLDAMIATNQERQQTPGLKTGFAQLDTATGGIIPGTVSYIYGATGMGKSTLAASIAGVWEHECYRGLYVTTELQPHYFLLRVLAAMARVPKSEVDIARYKEADAHQRVKRARQAMECNGSIFVDAIAPSPAGLRAAVLEAAQKSVNFVIVDSVSNMANAGEYSDGYAVNQLLMSLARETRLPFLVTTQVNRDVGNRPDKVPRLNDAYGGGFIEHNAQIAIAAYRHDYYVARDMAERNETRYPAGTMDIVLQKVRDARADNVEGMHVTCRYVAGAGVYPRSRIIDNDRNTDDD